MPDRKKHRTYSRRAITRQLGSIAGGAALLGPALAGALARTPGQTEGPFYPPAPHAETDVDLTLLDGHTERAAGDTILVRGRVTDLIAEGMDLGQVLEAAPSAEYDERWGQVASWNQVDLLPMIGSQLGLEATVGVGHQADHVASFVGDAGNRVGSAVRVRVVVALARLVHVAKHDAAIAF